jgi:L-asparaginase
MCQRQGYDDGFLQRIRESLGVSDLPLVTLTRSLRALLADCLPTPQLYSPLPPSPLPLPAITTTRSMAASGTGNGDSFLRTAAVRTVAAMARFRPESTARSITHVSGPNGELQRSAGHRWGRTGEGEGGMIGIECAVVRDAEGRILETRADVLMDFNCGGMFRGWIDEEDQPVMSIWTNGGPDDVDW